MQHLVSKYKEEDVADEAETKDLLQRRTESPDAGEGIANPCNRADATNRQQTNFVTRFPGAPLEWFCT